MKGEIKMANESEEFVVKKELEENAQAFKILTS